MHEAAVFNETHPGNAGGPDTTGGAGAGGGPMVSAGIGAARITAG